MKTIHCSFPLFNNFSSEQVDFTMIFDDRGEIGTGCYVSIVLQGTVALQNFLEETIPGIRTYAISNQMSENIYIEEKIEPRDIAWYIYYTGDLGKPRDTLMRISSTWDSESKRYIEPTELSLETKPMERAYILGMAGNSENF